MQVQESLKRDPHAGDLYIFRGRRGDLAKILWHDGIGLSLYAKRLDRGKFIWPSASGWRGVDLGGADGVHARRDRLAKSATDMAAQERRAERDKIWGRVHFGAPQITQFMILLRLMDADRAALPDEIAALKAALVVERAKGLEVTAELAVARAKASEDAALIAQQKLADRQAGAPGLRAAIGALGAADRPVGA